MFVAELAAARAAVPAFERGEGRERVRVKRVGGALGLELGGGLGVTDPVSGEVVAEMP